MHDLTLLERIDSMENARNGTTERQRLERSLVRHLTSILNTRRGSVPIAPDYGIADVTDLGRSFTEESVAEFKTDLEHVIMRYEPRLVAVRVEYSPRPDTPLSAAFEIEAAVNTEYGRQTLRFETTLDVTGAVRLSGGAS
ncbi:MAG: type VI secretion system baseplate subunit TssE [Desulfovibrio sp.]|jgi:type VI secretion system protein|nr:type VI secretion system baseplate subunit TssE [Desulfovibrio sp.]